MLTQEKSRDRIHLERRAIDEAQRHGHELGHWRRVSDILSQSRCRRCGAVAEVRLRCDYGGPYGESGNAVMRPCKPHRHTTFSYVT